MAEVATPLRPYACRFSIELTEEKQTLDAPTPPH